MAKNENVGRGMFKPRGRALGDAANMRRQTDSAAYTVELLQRLLTEQQRTNDLLQQLTDRMPPA